AHTQPGRAGQAGRAQQGEVVARVEPDGLCVEVVSLPAELDRRVALAGDYVGVRDDQAVGRHPAAALDAEPAGGAEDLHDAAPGRVHLRVAGDARVRRPDVRGRAFDLRERVEAGERAQDRTRGRQVV